MTRTNFHGTEDVKPLKFDFIILLLFPTECLTIPSRKHAYLNILKILPPKNDNFQIKHSDMFHISAQNRDSGYWLKLPHRGVF